MTKREAEELLGELMRAKEGPWGKAIEPLASRVESLVQMLQQAMRRLEITTSEWKEVFGDSSENSTPGDVLEKNENLLSEWNKPEPAKREDLNG